MQSPDKALQGRAAGVQISAASGQPGGALSVRVRGISSLSASNEPLWIVDGVQMGTSVGTSAQGSSNILAGINPNDIESIEVLKDAGAAAIYGSQAANGVILVTTKKGKKGKTTINFTAQAGIIEPMNLYKMMNAQQFAEIKRESYINAGIPTTGPSGSDVLFGDPTNPSSIQNYDWVKAIFKNGNLNTYDLSASGGDEKTTFNFSGSYQKQDGQVTNSDWTRGTARLNVTHRPSAKLTFGANISLSYTKLTGAIANGNFVNGPWQAGFTSQTWITSGG